jgi:hypothetical protein
MGVFWFAVMKLVLLAGPIFLLEWARRRRPKFTLNASRFGIGAYCGMYAIGFLHLNPDVLRPTSAAASPAPRHYNRKQLKPRMQADFEAARKHIEAKTRRGYQLTAKL